MAMTKIGPEDFYRKGAPVPMDHTRWHTFHCNYYVIICVLILI